MRIGTSMERTSIHLNYAEIEELIKDAIASRNPGHVVDFIYLTAYEDYPGDPCASTVIECDLDLKKVS